MDMIDKLFPVFASSVYVLLYAVYYFYRGKLNHKFFINNIKGIIFNYVYMNYTYLEFLSFSMSYYMFSWYVFIEFGLVI